MDPPLSTVDCRNDMIEYLTATRHTRPPAHPPPPSPSLWRGSRRRLFPVDIAEAEGSFAALVAAILASKPGPPGLPDPHPAPSGPPPRGFAHGTRRPRPWPRTCPSWALRPCSSPGGRPRPTGRPPPGPDASGRGRPVLASLLKGESPIVVASTRAFCDPPSRLLSPLAPWCFP